MRPVKPARFILLLLGVALFLTIGTVLIFSAIAQSSGTPMLAWGTGAGTMLGLALLAALILRAILFWVENRKQRH
jgi:hypothetical protein